MRMGGGWPQSGEIDMMEDVNGLNEASQTLHDAANSPGHGLIACPGAGSGCQTGYHTYSVIIDRTNASAETLQFLMDGTVESTITEASVGTTAWQQAIDHGFFIIFDLAMGGNYPNGICNCTTPTSATTSGASMSVGYVAVYEQGGNSTPTATATATGAVKGINGLCLANQNALNTAGNPIVVSTCNGGAGQQWSSYSDNTLRVQGQDRHRLVDRERGLPRRQRGGRQYGNPVVQRVQRPAMARGRPGLLPGHLPGHPELGSRLRQGLPDPDVHGRVDLDQHLLHHHRYRRDPDPAGDGHRTVHPHVRHRPRHPVRLLPVGIPGLRQLTAPTGPGSRNPAPSGLAPERT